MNLNDYQKEARKTAIYPGHGSPLGLLYCGLKLNGEAGEFAEHLGKAMRDDGYVTISQMLTFERKMSVLKELGDVLWYVANSASELGFTLEDVALENIKKLKSRAQRGKIQGSGDDR